MILSVLQNWKGKVITMLIDCTKKSRTAMRDQKHLFQFDTSILPPKAGDVHA